MKLLKNIILETYKPRFKCGEQLIGSLVGSGVGLFGDLLANEQSASNVDAQLAAQRQENQLNRDWQTQEAEKSRQFTTSERLQQQNYQTSERVSAAQENLRQSERMAEVNAMYNSPVYQSKELNKARINPQVYYGQSSSFGGSSQSALGSHAGAAPTGVAPHGVGSVAGLSPVPFQPLHLRVPELQQGIASLIKAGSEAKVAPAQIKSLLSQALNNEKDARYKELLTDYQSIANDLFKANFPRNIEKSIIEVEILRQNKLNAEKQGKVFDSQDELNRAEASLKKAMSKLTGEQAWQAAYMNSRIDEWYQNAQEEVRSRSEANRASAEHSRALATTENDLRQLRGLILTGEALEKQETTWAKVETILEELQSRKLLAKAQQHEARRRADQLKEYLDKRDRSKLFKATDDFIGWIAGNVGLSLSGSVSSSSSTIEK